MAFLHSSTTQHKQLRRKIDRERLLQSRFLYLVQLPLQTIDTKQSHCNLSAYIRRTQDLGLLQKC